MLPLDSERWAQLRSSVDADGTLAAQLLASARSDPSALDELHEQTCHQLSVGEVAYAVVPHLVSLASAVDLEARIRALAIVGCVAAGAAAFPRATPPIPPDLQQDYRESLKAALPLALGVLGSESLGPGQVTDLLGTVAALRGHHNLALHLLLHGGSNDDLSCPECGEPIVFAEDA